jgi:hypothetical protein
MPDFSVKSASASPDLTGQGRESSAERNSSSNDNKCLETGGSMRTTPFSRVSNQCKKSFRLRLFDLVSRESDIDWSTSRGKARIFQVDIQILQFNPLFLALFYFHSSTFQTPHGTNLLPPSITSSPKTKTRRQRVIFNPLFLFSFIPDPIYMRRRRSKENSSTAVKVKEAQLCPRPAGMEV